jgi:uncharacterized protein HemX
VAELSEQQAPQADKAKASHRPHKGFWFSIIILLIVAAVAGAGFYLFMQLRDRQEGLGGEVKGQMSKQLADYQNQLTAIQSQLAALEANIGSKDSHFTQTLADFSKLHDERLAGTRKELNESIQHIQRQLGKTRGDWLIADAEYLLGIANERLHLIGDVNTTREALEAADQRLRESGDTGVIKVREQIAKDIAVLRGIDMPDIVGIYATLQGLESTVDKLALLLPYSGKTLTPNTEKSAGKTKAEQDLLESALNELEGIVTIRHTDQPIKAILTPEQAQFIREQLRVKLEIVKIALVERNEPIYQSSLDDVKGWVGQHFAKNDDSKTLLDELNRLSAIKIRNQFPDMSLSFKMLRDISKLRLEADKGMKTEEVPAETTVPPQPPKPAGLMPPPAETVAPPAVQESPAAE